jgi:hypothetical protein
MNWKSALLYDARNCVFIGQAVDIFYGGRIGHHARIGTLLKEKVPVRELADTLADLLTDERYFTGIYVKKQKEINYV